MRTFTIFTLVFLLFACTKRETLLEQTHTNQVIEDNTAPPFNGVTTLQIQTYINKAYIDLIGREPFPSEMDAGVLLLEGNDLNDASKDALLNQLFSKDEYYNRFWEFYSSQMLEGVTRQQLQDRVFELQLALTLFEAQGDEVAIALVNIELTRTQNLLNAAPLYRNGTISINEFMARIINNEVFDDINMGTENFVVACFENLLKRRPTTEELQNGGVMVDGFAVQLLFKEGNSKAAFIEIMTTVPEFYQGLIIDIYQQMLARAPTSQEMSNATAELQDSGNFQAVQRMVMKTDEYSGF